MTRPPMMMRKLLATDFVKVRLSSGEEGIGEGPTAATWAGLSRH